MAVCCNNVQGISCNRSANNGAVIIIAIIALILINVLDNESSGCIGQLLITLGDLMQVGATENCICNVGNLGNQCNYY